MVGKESKPNPRVAKKETKKEGKAKVTKTKVAPAKSKVTKPKVIKENRKPVVKAPVKPKPKVITKGKKAKVETKDSAAKIEKLRAAKKLLLRKKVSSLNLMCNNDLKLIKSGAQLKELSRYSKIILPSLRSLTSAKKLPNPKEKAGQVIFNVSKPAKLSNLDKLKELRTISKCSYSACKTEGHNGVKCALCHLEFHFNCVQPPIIGDAQKVLGAQDNVNYFCSNCIASMTGIKKSVDRRTKMAEISKMVNRIKYMSYDQKNTDRPYALTKRERKCNLIFSRVSESTGKTGLKKLDYDYQKINSLIKALVGVENALLPCSLYRIGKLNTTSTPNNFTRPIRVRIRDFAVRNQILAKSPEIRNLSDSRMKHIKVTPDYMPDELRVQRALGKELYIRRAKGEKVNISHGKIVVKKGGKKPVGKKVGGK